MTQPISEVSGMNQQIMAIVDQDTTPISAEDALELNDIRLSKNQKLRLEHKGFIEVENDYADEDDRTDIDGNILDRSTWSYAENDAGVFVSYPPVADAIVKAESGMVVPDDIDPISEDFVSLPDDNAVGLVEDLPGRTGGVPMTDENYKTISGWEQVDE